MVNVTPVLRGKKKQKWHDGTRKNIIAKFNFHISQSGRKKGSELIENHINIIGKKALFFFLK